MEKYEIIKQIGAGAFGTVFKAIDVQTKDIVAIKKIPKKRLYINKKILREKKVLEKMDHPNIIKLIDYYKKPTSLHLVFEFMDSNLLNFIKANPNGIELNLVKNIIRQIAQGLQYMHSKGYYHRDMKPENILISGTKVKIIDFGLVQKIDYQKPLTQYISTRWYRAPELILRSRTYGKEIDIWALGAISYELVKGKVLFPGEDEIDQLHRFNKVLGVPDENNIGGSWKEGLDLASKQGFEFSLEDAEKSIFDDSIMFFDEFIAGLLRYNPMVRFTSTCALCHSFLNDDVGASEVSSQTNVSLEAITKDIFEDFDNSIYDSLACFDEASLVPEIKTTNNNIKNPIEPEIVDYNSEYFAFPQEDPLVFNSNNPFLSPPIVKKNNPFASLDNSIEFNTNACSLNLPLMDEVEESTLLDEINVILANF